MLSWVSSTYKKVSFTVTSESILSIVEDLSPCLGKLKTKRNRENPSKKKEDKKNALCIWVDVSIEESYKVLYLDDPCLYEGKILHTKSEFNAILQDISTLPDI